jgi:hypothetical protein
MDEIHKKAYLGHLGYQNMIVAARKQYYWPGMKKDIV